MKLTSKVVLVAGMLTIPAAGTAQVANHVSMRLDLAASGQPAFWSGWGLGLAYQPVFHTPGFGFGASSYVSIGLGFNSYYDDYRYGYHDGWGLSHCWDYLWHDPFLDCGGYLPIGFGPFGWWGPRSPWLGPFGFLGWPSPRYVRQHFYAASPFWYGGYSGWHDGWGGYPGYAWGGYPGYGWGGDYRHFRRYYTLDGYGGRVSRYGYSSRGGAVYRTPLFGPRFKERPAVYVTDNGPERPVSELSPAANRATRRGLAGGADRTNIGSRATRPGAQALPRTARPRGQGDAKAARPDTRTANPRPATRRPPVRTSRPSPVGTTPPKVRKRPEAAPRTGSVTPRRQPAVRPTTPRRQPAVRPTTPRRQPIVRTTPPRRQPTVRPTTPRRSPPKARSAPSRRPPPTARSAPPRRSPPKARAAPPRRSPPKVRPAPSRRSPPKARPAPRRSGGSKAPPKRSGPRRRGG